jgi:hypothetical protein
MGMWLASWQGDHAGSVIGRQPNRILISLTHTDGTFPPGLFKQGELGGLPWYYEVNVTCLTPGTREAIATAVVDVGDYVWSVEVAEVDWGSGKLPWAAGVHLFSVMLLAGGGHQSGTIGTAIIDDEVKRIQPIFPVETRRRQVVSAKRQNRRK